MVLSLNLLLSMSIFLSAIKRVNTVCVVTSMRSFPLLLCRQKLQNFTFRANAPLLYYAHVLDNTVLYTLMLCLCVFKKKKKGKFNVLT